MSIFNLLKKGGPGIAVVVVLLVLKCSMFCNVSKDKTAAGAIDKCLDKIFPVLPEISPTPMKQKNDSKPKARIDETKTLDIPMKFN